MVNPLELSGDWGIVSFDVGPDKGGLAPVPLFVSAPPEDVATSPTSNARYIFCDNAALIKKTPQRLFSTFEVYFVLQQIFQF